MLSNQWLEDTGVVFRWVAHLACLNLLWICGTLCGVLIMGFAPSTVALFAVLRSMIRNDNAELSLSRLFLSYYRQDFWQANLVFWPLVLVGIVLYADFQILALMGGWLSTVLSCLTLIIGVFYSITCVFCVPVYVHFDLKWWAYYRSALFLGLLKPLHFLAIVSSVAVVSISCCVRPLFLFFGASAIAFIIIGVIQPVLDQLSFLGRSGGGFGR